MAKRKKAWRVAKIAAGCEFCGRKLPPSIKKGLEFAHIVAEVHFGKGDPDVCQENGFILCAICHDVFDHVIKPRLETARVWSQSPKSSVSPKPVCSSDADFLKKLS